MSRKAIAGYFILLIAMSALSSCMTTKTDVGRHAEIPGSSYKFSSGKQIWIFWGIIPLGRTKVNTPGHGNCQVVTRYKFSDFLINCVTLGLFTSYSIEVRVKRDNWSYKEE
jgi:hypothetical protein